MFLNLTEHVCGILLMFMFRLVPVSVLLGVLFGLIIPGVRSVATARV